MKNSFFSKENIKFARKYFIFCMILVVGIIIQGFIHEEMHGLAARHYGYGFQIQPPGFFTFNTQILGLEANPPAATTVFYVLTSPYIFDTTLLLLSLVLLISFRKKVFFYIGLFPFLDILGNMLFIPLAMYTQKSNDFLTLFNLSNIYPILAIIPFVFTISSILLFYMLFYNYKKHN